MIRLRCDSGEKEYGGSEIEIYFFVRFFCDVRHVRGGLEQLCCAMSLTSKSGSLTCSFAGEPDGVPDWPNGVSLGAGYVVPRTGGHGVVRV